MCVNVVYHALLGNSCALALASKHQNQIWKWTLAKGSWFSATVVEPWWISRLRNYGVDTLVGSGLDLIGKLNKMRSDTIIEHPWSDTIIEQLSVCLMMHWPWRRNIKITIERELLQRKPIFRRCRRAVMDFHFSGNSGRMQDQGLERYEKIANIQEYAIISHSTWPPFDSIWTAIWTHFDPKMKIWSYITPSLEILEDRCMWQWDFWCPDPPGARDKHSFRVAFNNLFRNKGRSQEPEEACRIMKQHGEERTETGIISFSSCPEFFSSGRGGFISYWVH